MATKARKLARKTKKLRAKPLNSVKNLKTPSPGGPVPIPYPN